MRVVVGFESPSIINKRKSKYDFLRGCKNKEIQQRTAAERLDVEAANAAGPFEVLQSADPS